MRKIILVLHLVILSGVLWAQDDYYYIKDKKIPLKISDRKIVISFKQDLSFESKRNLLTASSRLVFNSEELKLRANLVTLELNRNTSVYEIKQILDDLNKDDIVEYANPYYLISDSILVGLTNQFVVKLSSISELIEFEWLIKNSNASFKKDKYHDDIFYVNTTKNSAGNALMLANLFYETGIFDFCEPNFIKTAIIMSNDPFYTQQWHLNITGQNGGTFDADMDVEEAWTITTGREDIKIAIIDWGVDLTHPDLMDNLLPGFDASGNGSNGSPLFGQPHGTYCAGVAAAKGDNGEGVAGVAYNCSIIPISINLYNTQYTDAAAADAINWAWDNADADVISSSWGGFTSSSVVDIAINNAITFGRDGLGSVVLFSTGNNASANPPFSPPVTWPSSNPDVIAVGASTIYDYRADFSNFGSELDVVAPGDYILTTDISGAGGSTPGDYTSLFGGTSAACPSAAGVVALILSVNRCLTQENARRILELSCDKVGTYCYLPGKPHGLWNNEMGYGRINAYKAVQYANSLETNLFYSIGGTDQGASSNYTWIVVSGGCSQLAAASYIVKRHEVRTIVTFPNTQSPILIGSANGFSAANPSVANYFMDVVSLTSTSATLRTWVYEIIGGGGQTVGWEPTDPSNVRFNFTVLSSFLYDIYLQDENVLNGTDFHNAINRIIVGKQVTSPPYGDYIVDDDATVVLHAGYEVELNPGTIIEPDIDGLFVARSDPFFTCTQYPNGRASNTTYESDVPAMLNNFESITLNDELFKDEKKSYIINYPNPFSNSTTIEFQINHRENAVITLNDNFGKQLLLFKSASKLEPGTYHFQYDGINLLNGTYILTFQTDSEIESKKIIKIR